MRGRTMSEHIRNCAARQKQGPRVANTSFPQTCLLELAGLPGLNKARCFLHKVARYCVKFTVNCKARVCDTRR